MRRRIVLITTLVVVAAAASAAALLLRSSPGAAAAPPQPARGHTAVTRQAHALAAPLGTFGLALLAQEAAGGTGNVVVSPLSISDVLSMILNGASGQTAAEMRHALALEGLDPAAVNQGWADLITSLQAGRKPAVQIANSLWLKDGIPFNPAFLGVNRDFFAADANALPADPTQAADGINSWVAQRTAGLIKQIVSPDYFTPETILALVNTVHVKAAWTYFDTSATAPAPFTLAGGQKVDVPMMSAPVTVPVTKTPAYVAAGLATKAPVTAWIVVPRGAQTPLSVITLLRSQGLDSLVSQATAKPVQIALPRFKTEFSAPDLAPALEALGMRRAFSPQQAELQGIVAPGTPGRVYVQRVVHKAVLDVNEGGIEAAAATAGIVGITAVPVAPVKIRADRPFLMVLTDSRTQAPLFMAVINDPR